MNGYGITTTYRFRKVGQGLLAAASRWSVVIVALAMGLGCLAPLSADGQGTVELTVSGELLPTGVHITSTAAAGAIFQRLNPALPNNPDFTAGRAVATSVSPDGNTLCPILSMASPGIPMGASFMLPAAWTTTSISSNRVEASGVRRAHQFPLGTLQVRACRSRPWPLGWQSTPVGRGYLWPTSRTTRSASLT